ncbi:hypothetical protein [Modestobacter sp. SYSU DS0875]
MAGRDHGTKTAGERTGARRADRRSWGLVVSLGGILWFERRTPAEEEARTPDG